MKYSANDLIAFVSPNYPLLAEAGVKIVFNESNLLPRQEGKFSLQLLDEVPIGVIKVFPGIHFELFESIMSENILPIRFTCTAKPWIFIAHGSKENTSNRFFCLLSNRSSAQRSVTAKNGSADCFSNWRSIRTCLRRSLPTNTIIIAREPCRRSAATV